MSAADSAHGWDITVPGDGSALAAEFHRHGIRPGQRVHVVVVTDDEDDQGTPEALPSFFGSFEGPADLAERSGEVLLAEFPNGQ